MSDADIPRLSLREKRGKVLDKGKWLGYGEIPFHGHKELAQFVKAGGVGAALGGVKDEAAEDDPLPSTFPPGYCNGACRNPDLAHAVELDPGEGPAGADGRRHGRQPRHWRYRGAHAGAGFGASGTRRPALRRQRHGKPRRRDCRRTAGTHGLAGDDGGDARLSGHGQTWKSSRSANWRTVFPSSATGMRRRPITSSSSTG